LKHYILSMFCLLLFKTVSTTPFNRSIVFQIFFWDR